MCSYITETFVSYHSSRLTWCDIISTEIRSDEVASMVASDTLCTSGLMDDVTEVHSVFHRKKNYTTATGNMYKTRNAWQSLAYSPLVCNEGSYGFWDMIAQRHSQTDRHAHHITIYCSGIIKLQFMSAVSRPRVWMQPLVSTATRLADWRSGGVVRSINEATLL